MSGYRVESPTGYYHVIQRGTGKQVLFEDNKDYLRYLNKLLEYKAEYKFELAAYCLMQNHVHLLLKAEPETISKVFHRFGTSYSRYYNGKYEHVGHVFQGRYLSEPIKDEAYLRACVRYIHNNPVKAGYCKRDEYQWSSYNEYIHGNEIADTANLLEIIGGVDSFIELCASKGNDDFLDYNSMEYRAQKGIAIIRSTLGDDCKNGLIVKTLDKNTRDSILVQLRRSGLTLKQIEILTGVSKTIIQRVDKLSRS